MAKLSTYPALTTANDTDQVPITSGGGTQNIPVQNLIRAPFPTIGTSGSFSGTICDGTADHTDFQTVHDALPSTGGKMSVKGGTYNFDNKFTISRSNLEIELAPDTIIKASSSATNISNATGNPGLFHIYSSAGAQTNVTIRGGTIDCNNIADVNALSIWGGGTNTTVVGLTNVRFENVRFINKNNTVSSSAMIIMNSSAGPPNVGQIGRVQFINCYFTGCDAGGVVKWNGDYYQDLIFDRCTFTGTQQNTLVQVNRLLFPTTKRLTIHRCKFLNTKTSASLEGHDFRDASRTGGYDLRVTECEFNDEGQTIGTQDFAINIHAWRRVYIDDNIFSDLKNCVSFGQSNAGDGWKFEGNEEVFFTNNIINRVFDVFDDDASYIMKINGNIFRDCGFQVFSCYSQHFYTEFHDNILYNANNYVENSTILALFSLTTANVTELQKAAIEVPGSGRISIKRNKVIDDRLLQDPPGSSAATLAQVAGGSLGARTYFVRITYANDSGETLASTEQSLAISANNLLQVTPTSPSGLGTTFNTVSGIRTVNVYVSATSGVETLQGSISLPRFFNAGGRAWTEPTTGLIIGTALPSSNTTHALTKYGILNIAPNTNTSSGVNVYSDNEFYGIATPHAYADQVVTDLGLFYDNVLNDVPLSRNISSRLAAGNEFTISIARPGRPTCTASASGGTLATATYYYIITAIDASGGESEGGIERSVSVTGPTGSVAVSWSSVTKASSYRIYRSSGTDGSHRQAIYFTSSSTSFTDTGGSGTAGSPPATSTAYILKISAAGSSWFTGGSLGVGTSSPNSSAILDLTSTTGAFLGPRMTTMQKNALTAVNGMIVYDSTLNKFQGYENGAWTSLI